MARYSKEIVQRITELISSDSYTIAEICKEVGISESTYHEWKSKKSEFSESIKKAQGIFDEKCTVEAKKSLMKLVSGYTVDESKTIYVDSKEGRPKIKEQTITKKHYQPSLGAAIFVLTNKDPENWKNRQNNEVTGKDGKDLIPEMDLTKISKDQLKLVEEILKKGVSDE